MIASAIAQWSQHPDLSEAPTADGLTTSRRVLQVPSLGSSADAIDFLTAFLSEQSVLEREDTRLRNRASAGLSSGLFDELRSQYQQPDEWTGQTVRLEGATGSSRTAMRAMGLQVLTDEGEM